MKPWPCFIGIIGKMHWMNTQNILLSKFSDESLNRMSLYFAFCIHFFVNQLVYQPENTIPELLSHVPISPSDATLQTWQSKKLVEAMEV